MEKTGNVCRGQKVIWSVLVTVLSWLLMMSGAWAQKEQERERWIRTIYNENNGLPTGEANAVLQSQDGYIWIGGYGGLIRYDGKNFRNFSAEENGLDSSSIRALYEDKEGRLYIGTNDMGVCLFEDGVFTKISDGGEEIFYSVRSFEAALDGTVYVGTTSGLAKIEEENGKWKLGAVEGTGDYIIYDLAVDSNNTIWACSDDGKILIIRDDRVCNIMESTVWMQGDCYCTGTSGDGSIYLGSNGSEVIRLAMKDEDYQPESFEAEVINTGILRTINKLYEDQEGHIWVLADNGVGYIDEAQNLLIPPAMEGVSSLCGMVQDYEGNLWIASTRMGVCCFSQGKYYNYNRISGLEGVTVNAVVQRDGYSYIGTDQGLVILDEEFVRVHSKVTKKLESARIRHITCTEDGTLWLSLYGEGLAKYMPDEEELRILTTEDGLLSNQVRMTLELQDGSLAVAGSSGIDILREEKVVDSYGAEELPYPFILCMFQAEDGTLVAGSDGMGIYTIRDSKVQQYYQKEGLESGIVMRMTPDKEAGGVWVSAGNALYFWKEEGIYKTSFHDGVGSILDIQVIGKELWLMKSNGPIIMDREKLLDGVQTGRELSGEYGLTGTLVANSWNWLDEKGRLWLCSNNGVSVIDTENMPANDIPPRGAVTRLTADEETYDAPMEVDLPASTKRITLDIAAMSYTLADKSIEYYLEGFDEGKVLRSAAQTPSVSYTNLSGGDYVFHMTVFNEDGIEGDHCTVSIHKDYHFWEERWFWGLVFLGALAVTVAVFWAIYHVKTQNLKKRQAEYRFIIEQALHTFANTIDAKDKDTNGHSMRVALYSKELARRMGLSEDVQETIYYMALLHDIGKIGIPDHILKKTGKLTAEEWEIVRSHPVIGGEILKEFTAIPGIADGARYHHEYYNGKGYCEGLKGEEIPLLARIIAVADAFDAMCSKRYYHEGNTVEYAREEMERCSGTQFDPKVAVHMVAMIDDGFVEKL